MSGQGFPQIPTRYSFGPTYIQRAAPRDLTQEITAGEVNLTAWQMYLMAKTHPSVIMRGQDTGGGWEIDYTAASFDVEEALANPVPVANGFAQEITFAAFYPNEAGESRRFIPVALAVGRFYADVTEQGLGVQRDIIGYITGQTVGIEFRAAGGAPIAAERCIIQVWGVSQ